MQVFLIMWIGCFLIAQASKLSKGFLDSKEESKGWLYRTGVNLLASFFLAFPVKFLYLILVF